MILGIDEVGRGPWAGPLVVGAVVFDRPVDIEGLTDSKKLTAKRRNELEAIIKNESSGWGLGWVYPDEISEVGLSESLRLATRRAVEGVKASYNEIIIDGTINFLDGTTKGDYVTTMKKADLLVPSVSAASILAKVARDRYMAEQSLVYPGYGFESNVGYGTAKHIAALEQLGVTPLHRKSFAPIAKICADNAKSTKQLGDAGEETMTTYLEDEGFAVLDRNWRTKWCEIDIVATKDEKYYFIEVKTRTSDKFGTPAEAITKAKLRQMGFAAEYYMTKNNITDRPAILAAALLSKGLVEFIEIS